MCAQYAIVCVHTCVGGDTCVYLNVDTCWKRIGYPRDGVKSDCECEWWEPNSGPLEEQQALLTTESSRQTHWVSLKLKKKKKNAS